MGIHTDTKPSGDKKVPRQQNSKEQRLNAREEPVATAGPVVARLSRPTSGRSVQFAIVADAHLSTDATGTWKRYQGTIRGFETAIEDIHNRGVDAVFFAGDQTKDGTEAEFQRFNELAERIEVPWIAIPGNHDVPKDFDDHYSPSIDEFCDTYTPGSFPFVFSVGDLDLIGINSATTVDGRLSDTWQGAISTDQLEWLRDRLSEFETPIVVLHHNLAPLAEHVDAYPWNRFQIANPEPLLDVLEDADAPLVVSGHQHLPATTAHRGVRELIAPATCSFPQGYLLIEVSQQGTVVRFVPIADRGETEKAYWSARTGKALGQGIAEMALTRLRSFPLVDEWSAESRSDRATESGDGK